MNQHSIYLPIISNQQLSLKKLFSDYGIQFGFGVSPGAFRENSVKRQLIIDHAAIGAITNSSKMYQTQPEKGIYDFIGIEEIVISSGELGIDVYGHALSWHMQNPDWLYVGGFSKEELAIILSDHVKHVSHYMKGKVICLGVANEAWIRPDGGVFGGPWQSLDEDYVTISFESSVVKPLYNSFFPHPEHEFAKALDLVERGIAQAIGIQLHVWDGSYMVTLAHTRNLLDQIRANGGWCRFSEISVLATTGQSQADNDWRQSVIYAAIVALAIEYADIVRHVIVWDIKDPGWRGDKDHGVTLFTREGAPKPSYYAVVEELKNG